MRTTVLGWAAGMLSLSMIAGVALAEDPAARAGQATEKMLIRDLKKLGKNDVLGADGKKIGHIDGLAIDVTNGRIAYAVVEFDKVGDIGDKKCAVPWKAIQKKVGDDREAVTLTLNVDRERLARAKGIEGDNWPTLTDASLREMESLWQVEQEGPRVSVRTEGAEVDVQADTSRIRGEPVSPARGGMLCRASDLVGHDIVDQNNQKIAELHTVMVDAHSGKLLLGIIEPDEAPDLAKDFLHPVPFQALKVARVAGDRAAGRVGDADRQRTEDRSDLNVAAGDSSDGILKDDDDFRVTLSVPFDKVKNGPKFGEREWPEMNHQYIQSVQQAYETILGNG